MTSHAVMNVHTNIHPNLPNKEMYRYALQALKIANCL